MTALENILVTSVEKCLRTSLEKYLVISLGSFGGMSRNDDDDGIDNCNNQAELLRFVEVNIF